PTSKRGKSTPKKRKNNHGKLSINFREYFMSFYKRLESETTYQIREENFFVVMNNYHNDLNQHKKQRRNDNQTESRYFFRNIFN
ncbi:hypothetical protein RhiirB3_420351, partial [Rhizophagus irregularis]